MFPKVITASWVALVAAGWFASVDAQEAPRAQPLMPATRTEKPAEQPPAPQTKAEPEAAAQPAATGEANSDFGLLVEQILKKCRDGVHPDFLQFMMAMYGICESSAQREEGMLKSLLENKRALLRSVDSMEKQVDAAAQELATLDQQRAGLEQQMRNERMEFAAGRPAPTEENLIALELLVAQIAQKKAAQHQALKAYYKLPQAKNIQTEIGELQTQVDSAATVRKRWAEESQKTGRVLRAVNAMPKTMSLRELMTSDRKLEPPAYNISKHWRARGSKFNLFLIQMEDGQIIGGAMQPDPVQVYDVFGFIYGQNLSLLFVNKHDEADVLAFTARVEPDASTGEPKQLKGKLKREGDTSAGQEWVFK